jgi:hypothetical protein
MTQKNFRMLLLNAFALLCLQHNGLAQNTGDRSVAASLGRVIPDTIVRFPGTEFTQEIVFARDLKLAPKEARISQDYSQALSAEASSSPSWVAICGDANTAAKLTNPEVLAYTGISPVSLEAVLIYGKDGTDARIAKFRPSSVAAWRYLSTALNISPESFAEVDKNAEEVEVTVQAFLEAPNPEKTSKVLVAYSNYESSLAKLSLDMQTKGSNKTNKLLGDTDAGRALASLLEGLTEEKSAWRSALNFNQIPVAKQDAVEPKEHSLDVLKSGGTSSNPTTKRLLFVGEEQSQKWRGIVTPKYEYQVGRACVGIAEQSSADPEAPPKSTFASGSLIAENLVLTCAHDVVDLAELSDSRTLEVRFGPDSPDDLDSPQLKVPARLIYSGRSPTNQTDATLDFALLQITPVDDDQAAKFKACSIKPVRLHTIQLEPKDRFFIAGYPAERNRVIVPNAAVLYPHIIKPAIRESLLAQLKGQNYFGVTTDQLIKMFNDCYVPHGSGDNMAYSYVMNRNGDQMDKLPLIGATCSTIRGHSGGPACTIHSGAQFGIFLGGLDPDKVAPPVIPGWLTHEKVLPISAVLEHLDKNLKFPSSTGDVLWSVHFKVNINRNPK